MKRHLALLAIIWFGMVPSGFGQNRDIIQLQQSVALLLGSVRELQRSFDERMAVVRTLLEQSSDRTNQFQDRMTQLNAAVVDLQTALQNSVANASQKVDNLGNQIGGLHASLEELRARLDKLSQQVAKIETMSQTI